MRQEPGRRGTAGAERVEEGKPSAAKRTRCARLSPRAAWVRWPAPVASAMRASSNRAFSRAKKQPHSPTHAGAARSSRRSVGRFFTCALSAATTRRRSAQPQLAPTAARKAGARRRKASAQEPQTTHRSGASNAGGSQQGGPVSDYKGQHDARSTCQGWLRRRTVLDPAVATANQRAGWSCLGNPPSQPHGRSVTLRSGHSLRFLISKLAPRRS